MSISHPVWKFTYEAWLVGGSVADRTWVNRNIPHGYSAVARTLYLSTKQRSDVDAIVSANRRGVREQSLRIAYIALIMTEQEHAEYRAAYMAR